jgi:thiol-disulfide isomerase/thioredoxin
VKLFATIVREAGPGGRVLWAPVPALREVARGRAPSWPLLLGLVLAYGLSRPASLASGLAQAEHGAVAAAGLVLQNLVRFALPEWVGFAAAGAGIGLLGRLRGGRRIRLGEHAVAGAYALLPALVMVAVWGAVRLAVPGLPRVELPRSFGAGLLVLLPSLVVLGLHARAVWREPGRYGEPLPARALRRGRLESGVSADGSEPAGKGTMAELERDLDPSSRDPRHGLVFLGVALVGVLLAILGVMERWNQVKPPGSGEVAPDVTLPLLDGSEVRLSDLRGQVVVVDFWATWCPPCVESMPGLDRLARERAGDGFVALAVNRDDGDAGGLVRSFLAEHRLGSLRVALDGDAAAARAFRVQALPTMFVLDRDGVIVSSHVGGTSYAELRELVTPLLSGP